MATQPLSLEDQILQAKLVAIQDTPVQVMSNLANHQPADSHPFQLNANPFPVYPAPGAGTTQLLSYQVPQGLMAVINELIIVAVGGGFIDGSGNVVWRCWVNGAGIDGYEYITAHIGDFSNYAPVQFVLTENDLFYITVEVPSGQPVMPPGATTGARIRGWTYPLAKAVGQ